MNTLTIKRVVLFGLIINAAVFFVMASPLRAADKKEEKKEVKAHAQEKEDVRPEKINRKSGEITGEVSAVDKRGIAVVFNRDVQKGSEDEMYMALDKNTKFEHKQKIEEIHAGDTVRVQYERIDDEGDRNNPKTECKAILISFIKPAIVKPQTQTTVIEPEDNEQASLPLKGIK